MTDAADVVFRNAEVHTLTDPDRTAEAVAVTDGRVRAVESDYEAGFHTGVATETVDLGGRVLLPGFIDAHTHVEYAGRFLIHADLSTVGGPEEAVDALADGAREDREWILGYGYDESEWTDDRYLTREDLDAVSETRPVAAFRVDMHTASLNSVAFDTLGDLPEGDVRRQGADPTGVVVERAVDAVTEAIAPGYRETRQLVIATRDRAHERGLTGVHDMVRNSHAPRVYRDLAATNDLGLRVRLNYWADHLDSLVDAGMRTNDRSGGGLVSVGAIKTYTDGSVGGRTAKLFEPYADADTNRGQWVVDPENVRDIVHRADRAGLQVAAHAIGDEAVELVVSAFEDVLDEVAGNDDRPLGPDANGGGPRHRVEHAELATDDHFDRMAAVGVVASMQPNFHRWAGEDGLYRTALGADRRDRTNRLAAVRDADVDLAFGSDCMPMDPLFGVHHAVTAPTPPQRLDVTEALRAYTLGGAYAGFDEDRLGTVEAGKRADFTVLERSPWDHPNAIADIDVAMTVVDGEVVYDDRS